MFGLCGVVSLVGPPIDRAVLDRLYEHQLPDVRHVRSLGAVVFRAGSGAALLPADPQRPGDATLIAQARLDPPFGASRSGGTGPEMVQAVYRASGEQAPERLFGDWVFGAWHPREQRLVVARDHVGTAGLYYYSDSNWFAFASDLAALRALPFVPATLDESWIVESLLGWADPALERTAFANIRRLPPGHLLTLDRGRLRVRRYWHPADVQPLELDSTADYAAALRETIAAAVASRLPVSGDVASHLSGGMDSGTVAATAARLLQPQGRSLQAFTAAAQGSFECFFAPDSLIDEWPLASTSAAMSANIELRRVGGDAFTPISSMRHWLDLGGEPIRNPVNLAWILQITAAAKAAGCTTLLTGDMGNLTISWRGPPTPTSGVVRTIRTSLSARSSGRLYRQLKRASHPHWYRESALHPRLLKSRSVQEMLADQREPAAGPADARHRTLLRSAAGASFLGLQSQAYGIDVVDPTADMRIVALTLSIPPQHFIDPVTGTRRWLIREATKGVLAEEVRLNRRTGHQGADIVPRLRASSAEVVQTLDELATGPAAAYVDVPYLQKTWDYVRSHDDRESFIKASRVLSRGLMVGLFVNSTSG